MKTKIIFIAFLLLGCGVYGQVGIGTLDPDPSAQLDVSSDSKGILIPRVSLTSSTDVSAILNGNVNSLLIFNTSAAGDVTPGFYYWYTDKWLRVINSDDMSSAMQNTVNVSLEVENNNLVLTDSDNNVFVVPLTDINIVTTLTDNGDGTYSYSNEAGTIVTVDVPGSVISNFQSIITNNNVVNELISVLENTYVGGNVYYDGTNFTYVDTNGVSQTISFSTLVQANETVTTITDNGDGTYSYSNEAGTVVIIDVPGSVVSNFQDIISNTSVVNELISALENTYVGGNVYYDGAGFTYVDTNGVVQTISLSTLVQANETVTTLTDNSDGTYSYSNEAGTVVSFDVNNSWNTVGGNIPSKEETENVYHSGIVYIGDQVTGTAPSTVTGAKLHVTGNIQTTGRLYTTNSVYADYVFEKYFTGASEIHSDYDFKTLSDVKAFTKKYHHLPGVTPITDLQKKLNGYQFDLTELSIQQLEKIEELFLHAFELEEQLKLKELEIEQIKKDAEHLKSRLERIEQLLND